MQEVDKYVLNVELLNIFIHTYIRQLFYDLEISYNVCQVGNCFADFRDKTSKLSKVKSCNKTTFILRAFHWSRKILMQVIIQNIQWRL